MKRFRMLLTMACLLMLTLSRGGGVSAHADPASTNPPECLKMAPALAAGHRSGEDSVTNGKADPTAKADANDASPCPKTGQLGKAEAALPLDLAAVLPIPGELGPGFVNGGAQYYPAAYYAAADPEVTLADLAGFGFVGTYDGVISLVDPADPMTELQNVRIIID